MSGEFWVWESVAADKSVFITKPPQELIDFGIDRFDSGRKIAEPVPVFEFVLDSKNQELNLPDDIPIIGERMLLISGQLSKVLQSAGVDNVDLYRCRIVNPQTWKVHEDYFLTNILDAIYCIDWEGSKLEVAEANPEDIEFIDGMKLIESRLDGELVFRLGEEQNIVVVHRSVKEAVERAGMKGVLFIPADGFVDTGLNWETNLMGTHVSALELN